MFKINSDVFFVVVVLYPTYVLYITYTMNDFKLVLKMYITKISGKFILTMFTKKSIYAFETSDVNNKKL